MSLKINNKEYWKSLEQLDGTEEFTRFLESEFPVAADEGAGDTVSRRTFLTLMGASFALAGLTSCRRPVEKIVPYVAPPEEMIPGVAVHYNTTMPAGLHAYGLTVKAYDGRPIKIEGNPKHPATRGAANSFLQGETLNLYDPDRSKTVLQNGAERTWDDFVVAWRELFQAHSQSRGEGLAVLSYPMASPTEKRLVKEFNRRFPQARWAAYEPVSDENCYKGLNAATGRELLPLYHFDQAQVILSIDSDFMHLDKENLRHARGFSSGRRISSPEDTMNRLYVVESAASVTGASADHRLALRPLEIEAFVSAIAHELSDLGARIPGILSVKAKIDVSKHGKWIKAVAEDLRKNAGKCLVVAGPSQSIGVHALVAAINGALGNVGTTVEYRRVDDEIMPDSLELAKLAYDVENGAVKTLVLLGTNPVYYSPFDFDLNKVENVIHFGDHIDESGSKAMWHVPQAHFLESWGDAQSLDGMLSVTQPLIEPLYKDAKSSVQFLNLLATGEDARGYDIVRTTWNNLLPRNNFESAWRKVLHDGIFESRIKTFNPAIQPSSIAQAMELYPLGHPKEEAGFDLLLKASSLTFDGRYANNGWLQENPDPITKLVWDNAALVSPATAKALGVKKGDVVKVTTSKASIEIPIWIVPGQAENTIVVDLGFGHTSLGRIGNNVGVNAYKLREQGNTFTIGAAKVEKTGKNIKLVSTQNHGSMEGRPLVREASQAEFQEHPEFAKEAVEHPPLKSLWKEHKYDKGYQWGMSIDLTTCIGCGACTVACQSENNIAIVGKEQVGNGREMHWIRIDRYFSGDEETPEVVHQPVACQQCEMAPCESVCPVGATVHDDEGLNVMVYNRCVGTRYCSNNCPYKVRRFNFFNYIKDYPETIKMAQNPNVTVRSRGVMEKCTYCIQRINEAKRAAKSEGREIRDGEFQTACQQTCPTQAITFGNILDPESKVSKMKQQERQYDLLGEMNLKPRTSYLAKIRNPNPVLS